MNTEIKVIAPENGSDVIVRTGEALPIFNPEVISIKGNLDSPLRWIQTKPFEHLHSHILVNREKLTITLVIDENSHFKTTIVGILAEDERFSNLEINAGKYYTPNELGDLLRKNKALFENRDNCQTVTEALKGFRAKVDKTLESMKGDRGDYDYKKSQSIQSNLPEGFILNIPIYKGMEKKSLNVLIHIRPEDLNCTLYTSDVYEVKNDIRDKLFDEQIIQIKENYPLIVTIEQ